MRKFLWFTKFLIPASFVLAGLPALAQSTDPVADAARQAREKKAAATKPKKVYTEDDIPARKSGEAPDATSSATPPAPVTDANGNPLPVDVIASASSGSNLDKEAAAWKKKFADAHAKLATMEKELDILQREEDKSQLQYYPDPQKAMTEQNTRKDVNDKRAKIAAKQQEIAQQKQAITDLEDELRKSGGDSGWAR